mgnify:CR=1 FL=1|tara:strand:+ start:175 stop:459 length:285 start_codon:yes stop_codon:yes gene_type:complete
MSKKIFLTLIMVALTGCTTIIWKHPIKGDGKISTMRSPKGSDSFIRDYDICGKIADQYVNNLDKVSDPCLADRERIKCMKNKYGWKIKNKYTKE